MTEDDSGATDLTSNYFSDSSNISFVMFSLNIVDFPMFSLFLLLVVVVAHEILETAQSPNSPFLFYLTLGLPGLILGTWTQAYRYGPSGQAGFRIYLLPRIQFLILHHITLKITFHGHGSFLYSQYDEEYSDRPFGRDAMMYLTSHNQPPPLE